MTANTRSNRFLDQISQLVKMFTIFNLYLAQTDWHTCNSSHAHSHTDQDTQWFNDRLQKKWLSILDLMYKNASFWFNIFLFIFTVRVCWFCFSSFHTVLFFVFNSITSIISWRSLSHSLTPLSSTQTNIF